MRAKRSLPKTVGEILRYGTTIRQPYRAITELLGSLKPIVRSLSCG
jgi:hypothetical protein